jgi:hypothetical protein
MEYLIGAVLFLNAVIVVTFLIKAAKHARKDWRN